MAFSFGDGHSSDNDLSCGLPSPDISDDEGIKHSQDLGITAPYFCNKLRTLTQPFFPNHEPVVVLSDLFGKGNICEKTKKSAKEEIDGSRKSTSYTGYVSSPRWTKSPGMRSYDPCDITGNDEFEVAGVVFNNWGNGKEMQKHQSSKRDSDFPSLNESSFGDISELSKSNENSVGGCHSVSQEKKMLQSPHVAKIRQSPITSTPSNNKMRSNLILESPIPSREKQPQLSPGYNESPHCGNSLPEPKSKSSSKNSRRRSKKSLSNSREGGHSPLLESPGRLDLNVSNSTHKYERESNKERCISVQTGKSVADQLVPNRADRMSSPMLHVPNKNNDMYSEGLKLDIVGNHELPTGIASKTSSSPLWSNIVKKTSPCVSPVTRISLQRNYTPQEQQLCSPSVMHEGSGQIAIAAEGKNHKTVVGGQPVPVINTNSNREKKHRVQLISVDSSATPSKKAGNTNWPSKGSNDILAFENRFVEKIALSSTSPPKKVNPSPIKKLDFSDKEGSMITGGEKGSKRGQKNASLCRRQVSLISDLDWKKGATNEGSKRNGFRDKSVRSKRSMFCVEDYVKTEGVPKADKDEINEDEIDSEKNKGMNKVEVDEFWGNKSVGDVEHAPTREMRPELVDVKVKEDFHATSTERNNVTEQMCGLGQGEKDFIEANKNQVTLKHQLRKYARRYCYFVEGHHVSNISREMLFILQLLTCSNVECQDITDSDSLVFGTVHNCVYFAVLVIKRLRRLFSCLPRATIRLFASNHRIQAFSPKLHDYFRGILMSDFFNDAKSENSRNNPLDFNVIVTGQNWSASFSDTKMVHIFKCQRDNFFALYQRYLDATDDHPFCMEDQIHYVYDHQLIDHKSVVNLMHLAQLFLDLLLQSSVKQSDQVKFLEWDILKESHSPHFGKQFEEWKQSNCALTMASPSKWNKTELFFRSFIQAMRCPPFNEVLKNIIAAKIQELNETDFEYLNNLHSSVCLPDDQTPQRCEHFTATVLHLCVLAKFFGHLVFVPYSGSEDLSPEESFQMVNVREMTPPPLPFTSMLKQACENGHLSLTVPWMVQYLSMMDATAPKLTVYCQILTQMSSIQRHSWRNLYNKGHHNTGLLLTAAVSWLAENPALFTSLTSSTFCQSKDDFLTHNPQRKCLDTQRVVTSQLLYACCPYLNACHIPLVLDAVQHKIVSRIRPVMPLIPTSGSMAPDESNQLIEPSLHSCTKMIGDANVLEETTHTEALPVVPYSSSHVFQNNAYYLDDLTNNFLKSHPFLSHCVRHTIELMCSKVQDYALSTILKLSIFECRVKVRRQFMKMDAGQDVENVKCSILSKSNVMAQKISFAAKQDFLKTGDRVCQKELPHLIHFLASHIAESIRSTAISIAQKAVMSRLLEWARIQLQFDVYRKAVINEAEKCASTWNFKTGSLYPTDYHRKPEYSTASPELTGDLGQLHQMAKVMDTALACGSWYMYGQTRGPRPDNVFIQGLMDDFIGCIKSQNVSMDFSFPIMINFLMHLIIQYIVDAPQNWTDGCLETFVHVCVLFENKKNEDDRLSFQPIESSHKAKKMKLKVTNFLSVYSLEWLSRSESMDHSLMVYCHTVVRLVEADLISVEKAIEKLVATRINSHLNISTKVMIDRILVKVLELLFASKCSTAGCSTERVVSKVLDVSYRLTEWDSKKASTELQQTFSDVLFGSPDSL